MAKRSPIEQSFLIDKLTNSIENTTTGDSFQTEVSLVSTANLKTVLKKNGWDFDWRSELKQPEREIYKLTIQGNPTIIQGLMSIEVRSDHVYLHLIESAPFNKGGEKNVCRRTGKFDCLCLPAIISTWLSGCCIFSFKDDAYRTLRTNIGCFPFWR